MASGWDYAASALVAGVWVVAAIGAAGLLCEGVYRTWLWLHRGEM